MFWISGVVLFFIIVLSRKWIAEMIGMPWSNIGAFVLGYGGLVVTAVLTCSHKYALLVGIISAFLGAYFGGAIFGDSDSGGGY